MALIYGPLQSPSERRNVMRLQESAPCFETIARRWRHFKSSRKRVEAQAPVHRPDVASAMLKVMTDVLALGDHIELEKIKTAVIYNLVVSGFDEDRAREKVDRLVAARAPFTGWKPLTREGRLLVSGGPGGTGDARPAHLPHHDDGDEHAHLQHA